jgi:DNA adenine methylase
MKTPISYYGGKQMMLSRILPLIPKHNLYCEPFLGGAAVFFAKPKSEVEVINDLNGDVVNFYRILQTEFPALRLLIVGTAHSRSEHRRAAYVLKNPECFSSLLRAWAFWVQTNMSFACKIFGGWGYEKKSGRHTRTLLTKRMNFTRYLNNRLKAVQIESNDALYIIKVRDGADVFFYIDPPYFNSDCGHYGGYTREDFERLLQLLSTIKGKFLLSSYASELLKEYTTANGWYTRTHTAKISASKLRTGKEKVEVLTANYPI